MDIRTATITIRFLLESLPEQLRYNVWKDCIPPAFGSINAKVETPRYKELEAMVEHATTLLLDLGVSQEQVMRHLIEKLDEVSKQLWDLNNGSL